MCDGFPNEFVEIVFFFRLSTAETPGTAQTRTTPCTEAISNQNGALVVLGIACWGLYWEDGGALLGLISAKAEKVASVCMYVHT